jgi:predicted outer membrane protein
MRLTQEAFLGRVAQDGMLEREAGRLALERSASPEVRSFATVSLRDRARLSDELNVLAVGKGIELPAPTSAEGQMRVGKLWRTTGQEFDAQYLKRIGIEANKASIALFGRAARELNDPQVKEFVSRNLPILRQHLETGERLLKGAQHPPSNLETGERLLKGAQHPPSRPRADPDTSPFDDDEDTSKEVPMSPIDPPFPPVTRMPMLCLRWGAIFGGVAVGATTYLGLTVIGIAGGLAMVDAADAAIISVVLAVWASASLALASFAGGAVAAFASGLRRASDGVLHGAVTWAASTLLIALAATAVGTAIGGRLGWEKWLPTSASQAALPGEINLGADASALDRVRAQLRAGNRAEAIAMLQRDFGITAQQANIVINRLSVPIPTVEERPMDRKALDSIALAGGWLVGTMLLSLGTALGGGALGVKGHKPRVPLREKEFVVHLM